MKILIADDDIIPRLFLQTILVKAGHEVIVAHDGAEAWQLLQHAEAPRLAILDWLMPGLDGVEVCLHFKQKLREAKMDIYTPSAAEKAQWQKVGEGVWETQGKGIDPAVIRSMTALR